MTRNSCSPHNAAWYNSCCHVSIENVWRDNRTKSIDVRLCAVQKWAEKINCCKLRGSCPNAPSLARQWIQVSILTCVCHWGCGSGIVFGLRTWTGMNAEHQNQPQLTYLYRNSATGNTDLTAMSYCWCCHLLMNVNNSAMPHEQHPTARCIKLTVSFPFARCQHYSTLLSQTLHYDIE